MSIDAALAVMNANNWSLLIHPSAKFAPNARPMNSIVWCLAPILSSQAAAGMKPILRINQPNQLQKMNQAKMIHRLQIAMTKPPQGVQS